MLGYKKQIVSCPLFHLPGCGESPRIYFRGGNIMNVHELQMKFHQLREYTPENVNELLDFAKKAYIHNEISSTDYRNLVRELEAQGAAVPESYKDNTLQDSVNA
jgi:YppF-like protein